MAHEASVGWQGKRAKDKTPGGPRMYRVERGKGDRERSKKSGREDNADTSEKQQVKDNQPTLPHAAVAQRLHLAITYQSFSTWQEQFQAGEWRGHISVGVVIFPPL